MLGEVARSGQRLKTLYNFYIALFSGIILISLLYMNIVNSQIIGFLLALLFLSGSELEEIMCGVAKIGILSKVLTSLLRQ